MEIKKIYKGTEISFFANSKNLMINATQMAKSFNKRPSDWLKTESTKRFIETLSNVKKIVFSDLQQVREGSPENGGGTWFHKDVALEFARWLSPEFAIWTNDRIEELLTNGVTTINNDDETILNAINILQKRLEESKARQKELENKVEQDKPKVIFADTVSSSSTSILVGELAKLIAQKGISIGQNRLFEWLRHNGYLCNRNGNNNYPTQKSIKQGLLEVVERTITKSDGSAISTFTTKITGKGQIYFVNKFINS